MKEYIVDTFNRIESTVCSNSPEEKPCNILDVELSRVSPSLYSGVLHLALGGNEYVLPFDGIFSFKSRTPRVVFNTQLMSELIDALKSRKSTHFIGNREELFQRGFFGFLKPGYKFEKQDGDVEKGSQVFRKIQTKKYGTVYCEGCTEYPVGSTFFLYCENMDSAMAFISSFAPSNLRFRGDTRACNIKGNGTGDYFVMIHPVDEPFGKAKITLQFKE